MVVRLDGVDMFNLQQLLQRLPLVASGHHCNILMLFIAVFGVHMHWHCCSMPLCLGEGTGIAKQMSC
jgi:hypothetical protein